jgi:5-methylcytosine-specific restriction endonuclease McrA
MPKRARLPLERGRAAIHKRYPSTIRLKDRVGGETHPVRVKLDPGSNTTGMAPVRDEVTNRTPAVLSLIDLTYRGRETSKRLTARRAFRRRRRGANLRYLAPRFNNRGGDRTGWLPPSLRHRIDTCMSWVKRLRRWVPVTGIAVERVSFDMQLLENPEISGVEYHRGTLAGYEAREYVLEWGGHRCAYCGVVGKPLNLDHVIPRARRGSNRPSDLVPACVPCNEAKDATPVEVFLADRQDVLTRIKKQIKAPLTDAAAVNATRRALYESLFNRSRFGVPTAHALDAACVGEMESLTGWQKLHNRAVKATGGGTYYRTKLQGEWLPARLLHAQRAPSRLSDRRHGARRCAERQKGRHPRPTPGGSRLRFVQQGGVTDINWKHIRLLQLSDGYGYSVSASPDNPPNLGNPQPKS